jgi:hypothetical protein
MIYFGQEFIITSRASVVGIVTWLLSLFSEMALGLKNYPIHWAAEIFSRVNAAGT